MVYCFIFLNNKGHRSVGIMVRENLGEKIFKSCYIMFHLMDNTNFSTFHENMAFWSLNPYSGINIYLISELYGTII